MEFLNRCSDAELNKWMLKKSTFYKIQNSAVKHSELCLWMRALAYTYTVSKQRCSENTHWLWVPLQRPRSQPMPSCLSPPGRRGATLGTGRPPTGGSRRPGTGPRSRPQQWPIPNLHPAHSLSSEDSCCQQGGFLGENRREKNKVLKAQVEWMRLQTK